MLVKKNLQNNMYTIAFKLCVLLRAELLGKVDSDVSVLKKILSIKKLSKLSNYLPSMTFSGTISLLCCPTVDLFSWYVFSDKSFF